MLTIARRRVHGLRHGSGTGSEGLSGGTTVMPASDEAAGSAAAPVAQTTRWPGQVAALRQVDLGCSDTGDADLERRQPGRIPAASSEPWAKQAGITLFGRARSCALEPGRRARSTSSVIRSHRARRASSSCSAASASPARRSPRWRRNVSVLRAIGSIVVQAGAGTIGRPSRSRRRRQIRLSALPPAPRPQAAARHVAGLHGQRQYRVATDAGVGLPRPGDVDGTGVDLLRRGWIGNAHIGLTCGGRRWMRPRLPASPVRPDRRPAPAAPEPGHRSRRRRT